MLQELIYPVVKDLTKLTIETVDRIQGMTCDITFFIIPFGLTTFSMNLNRFNVASSRSKMYTVIITDESFKKYIPAGGDVGRFWKKLLE